MANGEPYYEEKLKLNFKTIIYDLDIFNQDGFNKKGFDRNGFNINGIDESEFIRNIEIVCEEKVEQAIRENTWNIYYVKYMFRNK